MIRPTNGFVPVLRFSFLKSEQCSYGGIPPQLLKKKQILLVLKKMNVRRVCLFVSENAKEPKKKRSCCSRPAHATMAHAQRFVSQLRCIRFWSICKREQAIYVCRIKHCCGNSIYNNRLLDRPGDLTTRNVGIMVRYRRNAKGTYATVFGASYGKK